MNIVSLLSRMTAGRALLVAIAAMHAAFAAPDNNPGAVTYEAFGAAGDGTTDDLPAICKAHAHANRHGLPVRSKPGATYHLGRSALTAIIATDTDWGTSRFVIDDSKDVDDHRKPLFEVRSLLAPLPLKIDRLARGQTRLDIRPDRECLVYVENKNRNIFIRRGPNRNSGTAQKEVFILHEDGAITGAIDWDYDVVTRVEARPIDPRPLRLSGGVFTNIANHMDPASDASYWARNIVIRRSNTVVDGVTQHVTGEKEHGAPYGGFLSVSQCAGVTLRNCRIDDRKFYRKIGNAGKPVAMGTYGYQANLVVNLVLDGCRMDRINDSSRWGVMATNFMKNLVVQDCVLSRVDVHQGVSGGYTIRRSTIGHAGINAIGRGLLTIQDCTLQGSCIVSLREDYGSTWDGEILVRNTRWTPGNVPASGLVMFRMSNDGSHDFGYPCSMPQAIRIDGLFVDDAKHPDNYGGISFFGNPGNDPRASSRFPYRLTERIGITNLKTASGILPRVSANAVLAGAVTVSPRSAVRAEDSRSAGKK